MERGKRNNGEILLPEAIIQDVQSRLRRKEAAETMVLSKSWYRAWLTRSDVDLDYRHTVIPDQFSTVARKTMQRYDELNLNIETFRLCMVGAKRDECSLAVELVEKEMEFGANDIDIEFKAWKAKTKFILPLEVLGSEKLVRLSVNGCQCQIHLGEDGKVNCSSLKTLELCHVYAQGDAIFDIISSCPLIEKLTLSECRYLGGSGKQKYIDNPIDHRVFQKLTSLMLRYLKVDPLFFSDFSSKFPCLKDLTLHNCLSPKKIRICSHSLECINVDQTVKLRARIDVLSLRVLTCSSHHIPSLTFGTVSRQWKSDIHVVNSCLNGLNFEWFRQFKSFLKVMRISKLSLHLSVSSILWDNFVYADDIKPKPVLEDLTINNLPVKCSLFWDVLFWSCRPQLITISQCSNYEVRLKDFVSKRMTKLSKNCYIPNKSVYGQSDLKEVNVEVFDKSVAAWEPVTWKMLLDASSVIGTEPEIRFHFRWGR